MPLSEHEERALQEIARHLTEEDPKFVATVASTAPSVVHRRRLRYAVAGFVTGLVLLLGLILSTYIAAVGLGLMFLSVLYGWRAMKALSDGDADLITQLRKRSER
jgi:hypothetical protein